MSDTINKIDRNVLGLLSLVKESIYGEKDEHINYQNIDWEIIYQTAAKSNLDAIIYTSTVNRIDKNNIDKSLLSDWRNKAFSSAIYESKKYQAMRMILKEAETEGIKLVFFKGCILADLYPQYVLRSSSDTDIFVYERDHEKAAKLLERLGYLKNKEHSKEKVLVYSNDEFFHIVELHYNLWEDYEGKKIDIMASMELTAETSLIQVEACGIQVYTLGYEQHLIYQMFHIIKHFALEAVGVRYLADITLFVNRYGTKIDFGDFWIQMKRLGYDKFCYIFFTLCIEYLGMNDEIIRNVPATDIESKEKLLLDMLNLGVLYEDKAASWQIFGIITPYLVGEETVSNSRFIRRIKVLFPSRKSLPDKFGYAKKYGVLLPIAWVHKTVRYLIRYKQHNKEKQDWYGPNQKLETAEYRLDLMKNFGLVERK